MLESWSIVFLSCKLWFLTKHFSYGVFYMWASTYFFLLCHDLRSFKVLHIEWCSPHCVCVMWKEMIERINAPKKELNIIFLNVFPMFFFILTNFFFICIFIIWLSYMHHIIIVQHMFSDFNPFIPLQTCFKWHGYSSFKGEERDLNIQTLDIC